MRIGVMMVLGLVAVRLEATEWAPVVPLTLSGDWYEAHGLPTYLPNSYELGYQVGPGGGRRGIMGTV